MKSLKDVIFDNALWIITTLLTIGAFAATVKYQGDAIANNIQTDSVIHERVFAIEKTLTKMDYIQEDIQTIKEDIKDIKRIVLRPAISYYGHKPYSLTNDNEIVCAMSGE